MRVLVAGATGLIGRSAVRSLLASGHRVVALARGEERATQVRALGATPAPGDLLDAASVCAAASGCDATINLAWVMPAKARLRAADWAENDRVRGEGTRNLLAAAREVGAGRFVLGSTHFVYADGEAALLDEGAPYREHPFLSGARAAEDLAQQAGSAGIDTVILRFAAVQSAESPQTSTLIENISKGSQPLLHWGLPYWSMIHAEDAGAAVALALGAATSGAYNVVDDEPAPHGEIARWLAERVGAKPPVSGAAWLIRMATGKDNVALLGSSLRVSNARIREALGFRPIFPSYREIFTEILAHGGQQNDG